MPNWLRTRVLLSAKSRAGRWKNGEEASSPIAKNSLGGDWRLRRQKKLQGKGLPATQASYSIYSASSNAFMKINPSVHNSGGGMGKVYFRDP